MIVTAFPDLEKETNIIGRSILVELFKLDFYIEL
jgi:hypothetical protein